MGHRPSVHDTHFMPHGANAKKKYKKNKEYIIGQTTLIYKRRNTSKWASPLQHYHGFGFVRLWDFGHFDQLGCPTCARSLPLVMIRSSWQGEHSSNKGHRTYRGQRPPSILVKYLTMEAFYRVVACRHVIPEKGTPPTPNKRGFDS